MSSKSKSKKGFLTESNLKGAIENKTIDTLDANIKDLRKQKEKLASELVKKFIEKHQTEILEINTTIDDLLTGKPIKKQEINEEYESNSDEEEKEEKQQKIKLNSIPFPDIPKHKKISKKDLEDMDENNWLDILRTEILTPDELKSMNYSYEGFQLGIPDIIEEFDGDYKNIDKVLLKKKLDNAYFLLKNLKKAVKFQKDKRATNQGIRELTLFFKKAKKYYETYKSGNGLPSNYGKPFNEWSGAGAMEMYQKFLKNKESYVAPAPKERGFLDSLLNYQPSENNSLLGSLFGNGKSFNEWIGAGAIEEQIPDKLKKFKNYIDKKRLETENNNENIIKLKKEIKDFFDFFPEFNQYSQIFNKLDNKETKKESKKKVSKESKKKITKEDLMNLINEIEASLIKPKIDNNILEQGNMLIKQIEKKLKPKKEIELLKPKEEIPNQLRYFQYYIDKRKKEIDDDFETTKKTAGDIHDYNVDLNEIKMDVMDYIKSYPELEK